MSQVFQPCGNPSARVKRLAFIKIHEPGDCQYAVFQSISMFLWLITDLLQR